MFQLNKNWDCLLVFILTLFCNLKPLIKLCYNQVNHEDVIKLFCTLDLSTYHKDIGDCFMSAAFEAVDRLLEVNN